MYHDKQPLDIHKSVKALLAAANSKEPKIKVDQYTTVEIIKALQGDPNTDPEDLFRIEWEYLPMLDRNDDAYPKHLENRLASDPSFLAM